MADRRASPEKGRTQDDRAASLGFEDKLWAAADVLRNNVEPAEYKHLVLGLLFFKYVSDVFGSPVPEAGGPAFSVPPQARWSALRTHVGSPELGERLDRAMEAVEASNPTLKGAFPRVYRSSALDPHQLGELVELVSEIELGTAAHRDRDTLGRVYEYFLGRFASAEGRGGGEFYTPSSVVRLLVEMLEPFEGRVYDPCCGSGGMFVQSMRFVDAHGGRRDAVSIHGQESNPTTWRLARMNLALRGIEADLGPRPADTLHDDLHPGLQADFVLANPPFNVSNWGADRLVDDPRWAFGRPPPGNANTAWLQHILHHLSPTGVAGVVLANGSMSSQRSDEGRIRRALVEADLVDCMVALPDQLFYSTQIPACLWVLARNRSDPGFRRRAGEVLFIDARRLGRMETRAHRVLDSDDIDRIAKTWHAWRDQDGRYEDLPGFCKSATLAEIEAHDFVLTPGRYVGTERAEHPGGSFEDTMERLVAELQEQQAEARRLDEFIAAALGGLGW